MFLIINKKLKWSRITNGRRVGQTGTSLIILGKRSHAISSFTNSLLVTRTMGLEVFKRPLLNAGTIDRDRKMRTTQ